MPHTIDGQIYSMTRFGIYRYDASMPARFLPEHVEHFFSEPSSRDAARQYLASRSPHSYKALDALANNDKSPDFAGANVFLRLGQDLDSIQQASFLLGNPGLSAMETDPKSIMEDISLSLADKSILRADVPLHKKFWDVAMALAYRDRIGEAVFPHILGDLGLPNALNLAQEYVLSQRLQPPSRTPFRSEWAVPFMAITYSGPVKDPALFRDFIAYAQDIVMMFDDATTRQDLLRSPRFPANVQALRKAL